MAFWIPSLPSATCWLNPSPRPSSRDGGADLGESGGLKLSFFVLGSSCLPKAGDARCPLKSWPVRDSSAFQLSVPIHVKLRCSRRERLVEVRDGKLKDRLCGGCVSASFQEQKEPVSSHGGGLVPVFLVEVAAQWLLES